jgi:hypothetical protein
MHLGVLDKPCKMFHHTFENSETHPAKDLTHYCPCATLLKGSHRPSPAFFPPFFLQKIVTPQRSLQTVEEIFNNFFRFSGEPL